LFHECLADSDKAAAIISDITFFIYVFSLLKTISP